MRVVVGGAICGHAVTARGEQRGEHVGVGRGAATKRAGLTVQQASELARVDQVAVVTERKTGRWRGAERWLRVLPDRRSGGGVPAVADRDVPVQSVEY